MKKTRFAFGLLGIILALSGCGATNAEAAPFNIWPWIFGVLGLATLALAGYQTYCYIIYMRNARRRKRKNVHGMDRLTVILYAVAAALLLLTVITASFSAAPANPNSTTAPTEDPTAGTTEPTVFSGWVDENGSRYYMYADGTFAQGWVEMDGKLYYFQPNGLTLSGWHGVDGKSYYFRADGSMARGNEEIDGVVYHFTSTGAVVEVANAWNAVPDNYAVDLMDLSVIYATSGIKIDTKIYAPLKKMMDACNTAMAQLDSKNPSKCCVTSGYRSMEDQTDIFNRQINKLMQQGMTREDAEREAATSVAIPGTSEHQLGLAVDIVDTKSWSLSEFQDTLPAQQWLMEHCWEYGFILRYPEGKTDVTGIIYEPWHYRYVGEELALELRDSGLTLEEYLDSLQ